MIETYWQIGRRIVEEEQQGKLRADYGEKIIEGLAEHLTHQYGKGFSTRYLRSFRKFYLVAGDYQIWKSRFPNLTWTHIFKSWFVDFEPFKDKGMVESELGMIPEGWRVGKLGDIAVVEKKSINPSKQPEILFSHYSLPAYDESKLPAKQYGSEIMSNKFMFNNRTTLLSKLNPHIKKIWYVEEVEENAICSTEFLPFKYIDDNCSAFLYSYLVSDSFYKVALSMVQGATNSHQRLDAKSLLDFDLAIDEDAMKSFNDIVAPMLVTICKNRQENLRLSQLRDTLLPKLMSGEINLDSLPQ